MDNDNTGAVSTKAQSARWLSLRGSGSIDRTISRVSSQLAPDSTEKNRRLPSCSGSHSTTTFWADSYPPGILADLVGLTALYKATGGGEAWSGDNWLFPAPVGEWAGVTTGVGGRVTGLDLHAYNLSGELPPVLGSITGLRELNLSNWGSKDLGGSIPPELGNLVNLTSLDLHNNQLTGEIPTELGKLPNLTYLNLHDSQLRGEIPPELGNLAALTELYLDTNNLTGALPPELGSLSDLNVLYLHDNQLTGEFPAELGQPPDLRRITLRGNDFTWAEHYEDGYISDLVGLTTLHQAVNGTGTTGGEGWLTDRSFDEWYGVTTGSGGRVTELALFDMSGELPPDLRLLTNLEKLVVHNQGLTGGIPPELGNLTRLKYLLFNVDTLAGEIPLEG